MQLLKHQLPLYQTISQIAKQVCDTISVEFFGEENFEYFENAFPPFYADPNNYSEEDQKQVSESLPKLIELKESPDQPSQTL